jgi:hypothetical protein
LVLNTITPITTYTNVLTVNLLGIEYTSSWAGFELTTLLVIGIDCTGSCKSNYHAINTTVPIGSYSIKCVEEEIHILEKKNCRDSLFV